MSGASDVLRRQCDALELGRVAADGCDAKPYTARSAPLLVFADDWGRHPSSCQHLITRVRQSRPVIWVNTIGTRRIRANRMCAGRVVEKLRSWGRGLVQVDEQMWTLDLPMLPGTTKLCQCINAHVLNLLVKRTLRRLGLSSPVVLTTLPHVYPLIGSLPRRALIYYCSDDYSHWPDAERLGIRQAELCLTRNADAVLAVSELLKSRLEQLRACTYFPHAVDFEHFASTAHRTMPQSIATIPAPRIGFFGLIYEKIDFDLIMQLARSCPDASIVLIGPLAYCPDELHQIKNIHLLGPVPYSALPDYLAGLKVLMLPYRARDAMIQQSSPLKLRECLATGKPTVCVDVPEAHRFRPHVQIGQCADQFIGHVRDALASSEQETKKESRRLAVSTATWEHRAVELEKVIGELLQAR